MEYLKLFENHSQYEDFIETEDFVRPNVSHCIEQEEVHYNPFIHDYSKDYLTFVALENNVSFRFEFGTIQGFELSYSLDDGSTWNIFEDQNGNIITINKGEKILWKGQVIPTRGTQIYKIGTFYSQGRFNVMGNIMSLAYSDDFIENNQLPENMGTYFQSVFKNSGIVSAENLILPATTLANNCYTYMFENCTNLTKAPKLPATTLADYCYQYMFKGCTSLATAPKLPATTLANECYEGMFYGCTSLTTAPELPATTLTNSCYCRMFQECTSLVNAPDLPATTLAFSCYQHMFEGCTSLVNAPELPATSAALWCYQGMFKDCTSLTIAPELPILRLEVQNSSSSCYNDMFSGCTNLKYIKAMFTTEPGTSYTQNWVNGVPTTSDGVFVKNSAAQWNVRGVNGIPTGWTVETSN